MPEIKIPPELTTMVNLDAWKGLEKPKRGLDRIIGKKPLYKLSALNGLQFYGATDNCRVELVQRSWSIEQVQKCLSTATESDYVNSQWCKSGEGKYAVQFPCDSYCLKKYLDPISKKRVDVYIKFAIHPAGKLVFVFSCHG